MRAWKKQIDRWIDCDFTSERDTLALTEMSCVTESDSSMWRSTTASRTTSVVRSTFQTPSNLESTA